MKTKFYLILFFLTPALVFNSCKRPSKDIFTLIPETSIAVVTVHPGNLIKKGKLQELSLIQEGASRSEYTRKILEDPGSSGINLNTYSTFFVFGNEPTYGSIVMPLNSKEDFEEMLSELEAEVDKQYTRSKLGKYELVREEDALLIFDHSVALALFSLNGKVENLEAVAERLINLEKEERILSDKDFNNFLGKQKDINAWFTSTNLKGVSRLGDAADLIGGIRNNYGHAFLEFEKGTIIFSTNLRLNQTARETVDKFNFLDEDAIKELLYYMPSENLIFVGNTNVNPEKIIKLLNFINQDFQDSIEKITETLGVDKEEIEDAFSGETAFAFNGINLFHFKLEDGEGTTEYDEGIPVVTLAMRMKNRDLFQHFLDIAGEKSSFEEKEGYYVMRNKEIPAYMLLNKNDLIISNMEEIIIEIRDKGELDKNVTETEYSSILTENPVCFYLNLDSGSYDREMRKFIENNINKKVEKGIETFGSGLKSLSISANLEEWKFRIDLKEEDEFSLYTLLSGIDK